MLRAAVTAAAVQCVASATTCIDSLNRAAYCFWACCCCCVPPAATCLDASRAGDGICHPDLNNADCLWDGGDVSA